MKHEFRIIPWNSKAPDEQSSNDEGQIYDSPILRPFLFPSVRLFDTFAKPFTRLENGRAGIQTGKTDAQVYRPAK